MSSTNRIAANRPADGATADLADLIAQVAKGDQAAFRQVYDLTHRRLFGVALLLLRRRDAAEDAVQEAYIRIWSRACSYDPDRGLPLPWLARIVRNIALDSLRRKSVKTDDLDDHHDLAAEASISVFSVAEFNKCLATLDPNHRTAWWMTHLDGLSREEVALRMDVPLGTVKSWVFRSSRRLRAAVDG